MPSTGDETRNTDRTSKKIILFVCVENTFRSILSEAIFNARAPADWAAESAGVRAATEITPVAVELLREIGIELGPKTPRLATQAMIDRARRIVTFGCSDQCPHGTKNKSEDWTVPGSTNKTMSELRAIRDEIRRRVNKLIAEMTGNSDSTI